MIIDPPIDVKANDEISIITNPITADVEVWFRRHRGRRWKFIGTTKEKTSEFYERMKKKKVTKAKTSINIETIRITSMIDRL